MAIDIERHTRAINKLDLLILKKREKETKITELENEITTKNNKIFRLEKLFVGVARILNKRCESIDNLTNQLEQEIADKNTKEEQKKHLQEDIKRLDNEKTELNQRITELEEEKTKSESERDKELKDLKEKIKTLSEVKMAREKSEERLKKQSEDFLKVQQMNKQVYDILWKYSNKTGLLLRSQEVVEKLQKELSWWDEWFNDERNIIKSSIENPKELPTYIAERLGSTSEFGFNFKLTGSRELSLIYTAKDIKKAKRAVEIICEYYKKKV